MGAAATASRSLTPRAAASATLATGKQQPGGLPKERSQTNACAVKTTGTCCTLSRASISSSPGGAFSAEPIAGPRAVSPSDARRWIARFSPRRASRPTPSPPKPPSSCRLAPAPAPNRAAKNAAAGSSKTTPSPRPPKPPSRGSSSKTADPVLFQPPRSSRRSSARAPAHRQAPRKEWAVVSVPPTAPSWASATKRRS